VLIVVDIYWPDTWGHETLKSGKLQIPRHLLCSSSSAATSSVFLAGLLACNSCVYVWTTLAKIGVLSVPQLFSSPIVTEQ
jgi:hypothetical protein